jgi:hypothetical protein
LSGISAAGTFPACPADEDAHRSLLLSSGERTLAGTQTHGNLWPIPDVVWSDSQLITGFDRTGLPPALGVEAFGRVPRMHALIGDVAVAKPFRNL